MKINSTHNYGLFPSLYRSGVSISYAFAYKIMSIVAQCLHNKTEQHSYHLLANFYYQRANTIVAYFLFGSNLIAPIVNLERKNKLLAPLNLEKINSCFDEAERKKLPTIGLNKDKFPKEKITDGICFSFSLRFIFKYFNAIRNNISPESAILNLSEKFKEGGSEGTGIIQGISLSYNYSAFSFDPYLCGFQLIANLHHLKLERTPVRCQFGTFTNAADFLRQQMNRLNNGVYLIDLDKPNGDGHIVAYIKDSPEGILFDPNLGEIRMPEDKAAEYLIKSLKFAECNQIDFFKCSPIETS